MTEISTCLGRRPGTPTRLPLSRSRAKRPAGFRVACCLAILMGHVTGYPQEISGACACIIFDVPQVVTFQPCTGPWGPPAEQAAFFELTIPVSLLMRDAVQVREVFYRVDFPMTMVEVVDYLPRTTLESSITGRISIEKRHEDSENLGVSASASYEKLLSGSATAGVHQKESVAFRYDVLPELQSVITSGTLERRSAAYFKMRPWPRATLEGERRLVLVVQAPRSWRAGYALVTCRAEATHWSGSSPDGSAGRIQQLFVVALALRDDLPAETAARQLALADRSLRAAVKQTKPARAHTPAVPPLFQLAHWWDGSASPVPDNWLEQLMVLPPHAPLPKYVQHLPRCVQDAARQFVEAKMRLPRVL